MQLAHEFGINHVMFGLDYRESEFESINVARAQHTFVNRDAYKAYLQDKLDLTSRWTLSPGVLYNRYSTIKRTSATDVFAHEILALLKREPAAIAATAAKDA